jgi:peptidoglycan hydrolase CwlO-like protein
MLNKISFVALCLPLIMLAACVQKSKYVELENDLNQTQAQLEMENKAVADLREQVSKLVDENNRHQNTIKDQKGTIEGLENELEKERSVVQRKKDRLFSKKRKKSQIWKEPVQK